MRLGIAGPQLGRAAEMFGRFLEPALLAQHCAEAGLADKAVVYWLKAGQQAMARSATTEEVLRLQKGLDVLAGLPDGPRRRQQELDLQIALRSPLMATKGLASPDVGDTIARARALAEQVDRPEYLVPLLFGQCVFHFYRSEYSSRVPVSLLKPVGKILIFCGSFGGDLEFRDGTEIRGIREKIDKGIRKMGGAGEFRPELGLTKG